MYKKVTKGEAKGEFVFEYFNKLANLKELKTKANSVEDFLKLENIVEALEAISLYYADKTNKRCMSSTKGRIETENMIHSTEIV